MKIASITITSKRSKIIGDALQSVNKVVDAMVFVDLGMDNATRKEIEKAANKCTIHVVKGNVTKPTAHWRNLGLLEATKIGADYAIQLDTDERMVFPKDFKEQLKNNPIIEVFNSLHVDGSYSKERVFKLPGIGEFRGHNHEEWTGSGSCLMHGLYFDELKKSIKLLDSNGRKMLHNLLRQKRLDPFSHRWHFQIGLCHRAKDNPQKAIEYFRRARDLKTTPEGRAMDCYYIALCHMDMEDTVSALQS